MKWNIKQTILWFCINTAILTLLVLGYFTYYQYYSVDPLLKLSQKDYGILALFGFSVSLFALVGINLFSTGWKSYEEKYVKGAEESLDSMFLTIPPQHVLYISVLTALFFGGIIGLLSGTITQCRFSSLGISKRSWLLTASTSTCLCSSNILDNALICTLFGSRLQAMRRCWHASRTCSVVS